MLETKYPVELYPFRFRRLSEDTVVAISESGDHVFLRSDELNQLVEDRESLSLEQIALLKSRYFVGAANNNHGSLRLLTSRIAARRETVSSGPALHIIVPTLQCGHSCRYCQVSRALEDEGHTMSLDDLNTACDTIFESSAQVLTVEFQGGDPLLRFDLVRHAIDRITKLNEYHQRRIRFVIASTLHQLDERICEYLIHHHVYLSTSIDGPLHLHNQNRPVPGRNSYERTVAGIELARSAMHADVVSALVTVTRASLDYPEAIVDEYVDLGFRDIFLRPLSHYGFAIRNAQKLAYEDDVFSNFYSRAFDRVLYWNAKGVAIREVTASIVFNKILATFDAGYVDLQSPTGSGLGVIVYNYDGYVYPSDEARMLAEMGRHELRLGRIGEKLPTLLASPVQRQLVQSSLGRYVPGCDQCAYNTYCGPDPVNSYAMFGEMTAPVNLTDHCRRYMWLFDFLFKRLESADRQFLDLASSWAGADIRRKVVNA